MKIEVLVKTGPHKVGDIVEVTDVKGVPTDQYWRRRLRDAKVDNCCRVVDEAQASLPIMEKDID